MKKLLLIYLLFFSIGVQAITDVGVIEDIEPIEITETETRVITGNAVYMNLRFSGINLSQGDLIELSDSSGNVFQTIDPIDINGDEQIWSFLTQTPTVEVKFTKADADSESGFTIDKMGVTGAMTETICGNNTIRNIQCAPSTHRQRARSVGRLIIVSGNSISTCTGFLVSNNNHFLTNEHCVVSGVSANMLEVQFNYQYNSCNGGGLSARRSFRVNRIITRNYGLDYALLQLSGNASSQYGHLTINSSGARAGQGIYVVQHPNGDPKKYDNGTVAAINLFGRTSRSDFSYQNVDTAGGSSGSPVFNSSNQVIGLHHFGYSCNSTIGINAAVDMKHIYSRIASIINPAPPPGSGNGANIAPIIMLLLDDEEEQQNGGQ